MADFAICEVEDGLTVIELQPQENPEDAAIRCGGTLIDPGPYQSMEEACDALDELRYEDEEDRL